MYTLEDISYSVGSRTILHPLNLQVKPGKVTVLLGANGAGKSTLLKILSGELSSASGKVLLNQRPLSSYSSATLARRRAVLTQQYAVSLPFRCSEIVLMGRYPHFEHTATLADEAIALACMEEMLVSDFADRYFHTLSGGEQQRVQMARVLAQVYPTDLQPPSVLLLDEPIASMDCLHQQICLQKARALAQFGYTVVVVLHDLNLAAQYGDEWVLLKNGRVLNAGNADQIFQPSILHAAYGFDVDVVRHPGYDFPIIIPVPITVSSNYQSKKTA